LARAVGDVVDELRPEAERKNLRLSVSDGAESRELNTDARFLRVILVNLIGNAIKFTNRGAVEVIISSSGAEHQVRVRDDGPGIRPEDQERIFEPFERVEPLRHKHTAGFGLGLATSRRLAEALGARIELESQVGSGSVFTLILPASAASTIE
jgi:signal transduction histidine kinase